MVNLVWRSVGKRTRNKKKESPISGNSKKKKTGTIRQLNRGGGGGPRRRGGGGNGVYLLKVISKKKVGHRTGVVVAEGFRDKGKRRGRATRWVNTQKVARKRLRTGF